jgi:hypothetical protein
MAHDAKTLRRQLTDLFADRPGWRLEPQTTPGANPLWCYVDEERIEFSVAAHEGVIRLYVMATDREITFESPDALTTWLREHKADALREPLLRQQRGKARFRSFLEWS